MTCALDICAPQLESPTSPTSHSWSTYRARRERMATRNTDLDQPTGLQPPPRRDKTSLAFILNPDGSSSTSSECRLLSSCTINEERHFLPVEGLESTSMPPIKRRFILPSPTPDANQGSPLPPSPSSVAWIPMPLLPLLCQVDQHPMAKHGSNSTKVVSDTHESSKSGLKKRPSLCKVTGCTSFAVSRGSCVKHGGGSRCTYPGCTNGAKLRTRCFQHGGSTTCQAPGCASKAKRYGYCWSHGGGRICDVEGCSKVAAQGGQCWAHGGGNRCRLNGCTKRSYQKYGYFCKTHAHHAGD